MDLVNSFFLRSSMLIGKENIEKLCKKNVAVFGAGGVGGFAIEALVRSGIGNLTVIDNDKVSESNINRQIIATSKTIGKDKIELIKERALSINPNINIEVKNLFFLPENSSQFNFCQFDYVVDAIDTVSAKLEIIKKCYENKVPVISCMGTGGKLDPLKLKVDLIKNTSYCPLAKVIRRELKKIGIENLKVVYSKEIQKMPLFSDETIKGNRTPPPSMVFVPASAGILIAKEVITDLINV